MRVVFRLKRGRKTLFTPAVKTKSEYLQNERKIKYLATLGPVWRLFGSIPRVRRRERWAEPISPSAVRAFWHTVLKRFPLHAITENKAGAGGGNQVLRGAGAPSGGRTDHLFLYLSVPDCSSLLSPPSVTNVCTFHTILHVWYNESNIYILFSTYQPTNLPMTFRFIPEHCF